MPMFQPFVVCLSLGLLGSFAPVFGGGSRCAENARISSQKSLFDQYHRGVFFAVLQGCYNDGVSNAVIDAIFAVEPKSGQSHFVAGCPLCLPTRHALDVYRGRAAFQGYKNVEPIDTFGAGLPEAEQQELLSGDFARVHAALAVLVERWTASHLAQLRLTPQERQAWTQALQERRKKGMSMLQNLAGSNPGAAAMENCAICDGADAAGRRD